MHCKNCGEEIAQGAAVCLKCGFRAGEGTNYCGNCGGRINPGAAICLSCGTNVTAGAAVSGESKSKMAAGLLGIFLGSLGIHNFYLGFTGKAVAQLLISILSCGFLAIVSWVWGLVEGIMILTGKTTVDAKGVPLKD